jgi:hypothetical protein
MLRVNACASANSYAQRTVERAVRDEARVARDSLEHPALPERRRRRRSRRRGGEVPARDDLHRVEVVPLRRPPHLDYDCRARPRHAPGFPERRSHVACEEECVEPRDDIEAVVLVGEELQVAPAQVGIGYAGARKVQQRLPHRAKYLRLANEFLRRLVDLHVQLVDDVERELAEVEDRGS